MSVKWMDLGYGNGSTEWVVLCIQNVCAHTHGHRMNGCAPNEHICTERIGIGVEWVESGENEHVSGWKDWEWNASGCIIIHGLWNRSIEQTVHPCKFMEFDACSCTCKNVLIHIYSFPHFICWQSWISGQMEKWIVNDKCNFINITTIYSVVYVNIIYI